MGSDPLDASMGSDPAGAGEISIRAWEPGDREAVEAC